MPHRPAGALALPTQKVHADKSYDFPRCRRYLRRRGITPRIARCGVELSERLGQHRWIVERTMAWLLAYRRLAIRYDRQATTVLGLLDLACSLLCVRFLQRAELAVMGF